MAVKQHTVAATDTLDLGQGVDDLLLAVNVCVEQTQNVVEVALCACQLGFLLQFDLIASKPARSLDISYLLVWQSKLVEQVQIASATVAPLLT